MKLWLGQAIGWHPPRFRFLWPCIASKLWRERERKPTRCNSQMYIINFCLNMFRPSLCPSSGEQWPCVTAYGVLRWFCWMWLVAPHNQRSTPNAVTHGPCSPEDGHNDARNMLRQKLIIYIWLLHLVGFLSLHNPPRCLQACADSTVHRDVFLFPMTNI